MSDTHGLVWWTELMTRDADAARDYYASICGWTYSTMPMDEGDYTMAMVGDRPIAGIMDISGSEFDDGQPATWFSYFAVDDVDAACDATRAAGGQVLRDPFDVPGVGRIAILVDPTGAAMGLMTPAEAPVG